MEITAFQRANVSVVLDLMAAFNLESGYPFSAELCQKMLLEILDNPTLGRLWIVKAEDSLVGYSQSARSHYLLESLKMNSPVINIFAAVAEASASGHLPVLVIGGHAVNAYGYVRTTLDADFLICADDLPAWRQALGASGYQWSGQTHAFAKFLPPDTEPPSLPVDVMLVSRETFEKLQVENQTLEFGLTRLPVPQPLHLIALKLHAMKNDERRRLGKDLVDILQLVRLCRIDTNDVAFQRIVERYANQPTRTQLDHALEDR